MIGGISLKILEKILDYMISQKKKKLRRLEMQYIQDNYKLVMLQSENSKQ